MAAKMEFSALPVAPIALKDLDPSNKGAKSMIQAYQNHPERLRAGQAEDTLRGLKVTKGDLQALLKSAIGAEEFMILFAVSKTDMDDDDIPMEDKRLTAILAPVKENKYISEYLDENGTQKNALRNIFEPCPTKCNTTLEQSYVDTFLKP